MRKQARKRKEKKKRAKLRLPRIPFAKLAAVPAAVLVVFLSYRLSAALLDRPIRTIAIDGPFERVSALQIEAAIGDELDRGFFSASLAEIQQRIVALPWIDKANVARRWPDTLEIGVTEQVPAACWGERGLMNTRGELFVENARHVPAELPRLSGKSKLAEAIRYTLSRWEGLTRFLDDGRIEIDNNTVERSIRPIALNRKNALFAGSDGGADHWAVIALLIDTCKLNDVEPLAYLADVLTRIVNGHPNSQIDDLLPWAYIAKLNLKAAV